MKKKTLYTLLGALVVLIVIYLIQLSTHTKVSVEESTVRIFPDFSPKAVAKIEAYQDTAAEKRLVLEKSHQRWVVKSNFNAKAQERQIEKLLESLKAMRGQLRSSKEELLSDFQIGEEETFHLVLYDKQGTELSHLLVGKKGPDWKSSFVRHFGESKVYLASENLLTQFGIYGEGERKLDSNRWTDLKVFDFTEKELTRMAINTPKRKRVFEKRAETPGISEDTTEVQTPMLPTIEYEWVQTLPAFESLEEIKITSLVRALANLQASEVVDPGQVQQYGLSKPHYTVELTLKEGRSVVLSVGELSDKKAESRYCQSSESDLVYIIPNFQFQSIFERPFKE
ncbi:MAG: hypothetical protein AMJ41_01320 [candidate division Zixibacteria bacterium DG_27]|nr:MAG: hypothetical protein AMJ41_01320 [candidate division Zixibacteria bacterium DG_27]